MFKHILVPLDGTELAEKSLPQAQAMARAFDSTLYLLRVMSSDESGVDVSQGPAGERTTGEVARSMRASRQVSEARMAEVEEYLEAVAYGLKREGVRVERDVMEGDAADAIARYVGDRSIDLIVMATHDYSGIRRFLHHSVSDSVLQSVRVPVMVVPAS